LDLLSWDAYVYRNEHDRLDPAFSGRECDRIRDLNGGKRPFWIMETLPGFVNWRNVNRHFEPGESRSMAWHLLAHGADAVLYWQWRSAPGGQEQYHGSLLHQDGEPRPVYHEIAQVGAELQALGPLLDGSSTRPSVALIDRWCDRTALRQQPHHRQYDPATAPDAWYRAVRAQGLDLAVLEAVELADAPPLVIAPQLHLVDDREAAALLAYVEQGGHLILGPRSLMKNEENALRPERQPGPLGAALGASAIEYYALPDEVAVAGDCAGSVACFAEWWQRADETCEQWATFAGHPWLDGQPAVLSRPHGAGRISLCAGLADDALAAAVVGRACALASLSGPIDIPPAVELTTRWTADDQPLYLLINHGTEPVNITLPRLLRNRLGTDQDGQMTIALEAYGVALLSD
jgi:beta-galactosidase